MTPDHSEEKARLSAVYFPYAYPPEEGLIKLQSLVTDLSFCRPWHMKRPAYLDHFSGPLLVNFFDPSADMRPGEDFGSILSEYQTWISQNRDRGYTAFFQASQAAGDLDENTWEIRQILRNVDQDVTAIQKNTSLRWHLLLHLAQEVEDQRWEASRILDRLKGMKSPLEGALESDAELHRVMADLPDFDSDSVLDQKHLDLVIEAWFGLFSPLIRDDAWLITLNSEIMESVSAYWADSEIEHMVTYSPEVRFTMPALSVHGSEALNGTERNRPVQKRIVALLDAMKASVGDPKADTKEIEEDGIALFQGFSDDSSDEILEVTMKYLAPIPGDERIRSHAVLRNLVNKTIILMEAAD